MATKANQMLAQGALGNLREARSKLAEASRIITDREDIEEIALLYVRQAESLLEAALEAQLHAAVESRVRKLLDSALAQSEPLEKRPFQIAKIALDALIIYKTTEPLPRWDIEVYRGVTQMAQWRQRAVSHLSQLIGIVDKAIQLLVGSA